LSRAGVAPAGGFGLETTLHESGAPGVALAATLGVGVTGTPVDGVVVVAGLVAAM